MLGAGGTRRERGVGGGIWWQHFTIRFVAHHTNVLFKSKAPAERSQHSNATCRNMLRAFGRRVAMCCDMLGVVCSNLKMVKFEPTTPNMSQHGGQTHATCCAQQCCGILCWHVAIVWPGLNMTHGGYSCFTQLAGSKLV